MHTAQIRRLVTALGVLAAVDGCSAGSLLDTSPKGPSSDAVNALVTQIGTAFGNGMSSSHLLGPSASRAVRGTGPSATLVNVQVSQRTNCTSGGYINVTGSLTGSIDNNGSGVLLLGVTETINGWQCVGGWTVDGAPYLSLTGTFSYLNGQQSSAAQIQYSGGVQWTGPQPGGCTIQLTMLYYPNGSWHMSGTACGVAIDKSG